MDIPLYAALAYIVAGGLLTYVGMTEVWPRIQLKRKHKARGRKAAATRRSKATTAAGITKVVNGGDHD